MAKFTKATMRKDLKIILGESYKDFVNYDFTDYFKVTHRIDLVKGFINMFFAARKYGWIHSPKTAHNYETNYDIASEVSRFLINKFERDSKEFNTIKFPLVAYMNEKAK
jgi:hypothetical protein